MREIVKRTLVVLWVGWVALSVYAVSHYGLFDRETWEIIGWSSTLLWAMQFIATGIPNPFTLIESTEFRRK